MNYSQLVWRPIAPNGWRLSLSPACPRACPRESGEASPLGFAIGVVMLSPAPRFMRGSGGAMRIREWGPLSRFRFVITILAGNLKSHSSVHSLSLGQSLPPRPPSRPPSRSGGSGGSGGIKTARICFLNSFGCAGPALYAGKRGLPM
jgi:hypothetical protein